MITQEIENIARKLLKDVPLRILSKETGINLTRLYRIRSRKWKMSAKEIDSILESNGFTKERIIWELTK